MTTTYKLIIDNHRWSSLTTRGRCKYGRFLIIYCAGPTGSRDLVISAPTTPTTTTQTPIFIRPFLISGSVGRHESRDRRSCYYYYYFFFFIFLTYKPRILVSLNLLIISTYNSRRSRVFKILLYSIFPMDMLINIL